MSIDDHIEAMVEEIQADCRDDFDLMFMIEKFHAKFGLMYYGPPRNLEGELQTFRVGFMREELDEYEAAVSCYDLEGQLDALVDLVYVALGTAYLQGFDFNEAFRRVHAANMKKVRAESSNQSKRGTQFDVVKPEGWTPPYLRDLVLSAGERISLEVANASES